MIIIQFYYFPFFKAWTLNIHTIPLEKTISDRSSFMAKAYTSRALRYPFLREKAITWHGCKSIPFLTEEFGVAHVNTQSKNSLKLF